jgi:hypothetical protein
MTTNQPILDELHAVREQLLADAGGTLAGLVARIQEDQKASTREIRKSQRILQCTESAKPGDLPINHLSLPRER